MKTPKIKSVETEKSKEAEIFGKALKKRRDELGWSQVSTALFLEVSRATYVKWEAGAEDPGKLKRSGAITLITKAKPSEMSPKSSRNNI